MNRKGFIVVMLLCWAMTVEAAHEVPITPQQMQNLGITLATIKKANWVTTDRLPARVVIPPRQEHVVSAPASGLITELMAGTGEEVSEHDKLAKLISPDLITLQRELLQAKTEERLATVQMKRDRQLFKEGIISERRYLETRSGQERALAALEERLQSLKLAGMGDQSISELMQSRHLTSSLSVSTPRAGVILQSMVVAGQRVERSDPLFKLAQLDPLWLEIRVPLERLAGIELGADVELPCEQGHARVTLIGRNVDSESQTVLVRAQMHGALDCLRPGQYVQVRLKLSSEQVLFLLPSSAIVHTSGMAVVFAREPFGFVAIQVHIASQQESYSIVKGELRENQPVAVSGLSAIKAAWIGLGGGSE